VPIRRLPEAELGAVDRAMREAALALGYPASADHNEPNTSGVSRFASNTSAERRISTNDAYLEPARARANLSILGGAHVDRLLFAPGERRVIGVRLHTADGFQDVHARSVVLSAGADELYAHLITWHQQRMMVGLSFAQRLDKSSQVLRATRVQRGPLALRFVLSAFSLVDRSILYFTPVQLPAALLHIGCTADTSPTVEQALGVSATGELKLRVR
jgi:hypothetical protein